MIVQEFYLEEIEWYIKIYYYVDCLYYNRILMDLEALECENSDESLDKFCENGLNGGFTFSQERFSTSVLILGKASCPAEFFSTYLHEIGHLATHIALCNDIDLSGEKLQYILGEIGKKTFPVAKLFLCEHCNEKLIKN